MKKSIKFKIELNSKNHYDFGKHPQNHEYFFDDKQVTELEFYGLQHLQFAKPPELKTALKEIRGQEPADIKLFNEWSTKCALIENLLIEQGFFFYF